jgi:hypothetical protein
VSGSLRFAGALAGAIVGALLSWTAAAAAAEQAVPRNDGWVTDLAPSRRRRSARSRTR